MKKIFGVGGDEVLYLDDSGVWQRAKDGRGRPVADLSEIELSGIEFRGLDLSGESFSGSRLSSVRFVRCSLWQCSFEGCVMSDVVIDGCEMVLTNFSFARLVRCSMDKMVAEGVMFLGATCDECSFEGSDLYWAMFDGSTLTRCSFRHATMYAPTWCDCELRDVDWRGLKFLPDRLNGLASLEGLDLSTTDLRDVVWDGVEPKDRRV